MASKDILITGVSGFVGSQLLSELPGAATLSTRTDIATWDEKLCGKECVVHLAARVHQVVDKATDPLAQYRITNVTDTLNLARKSADAGVKRFIYMSSIKVNGESTSVSKPFNETDEPNPCDSYGISKWEAEQGLKDIARQTGLELVVIRPPLVYGPGVKANFASLMRAVKTRVPLPLGAIHNLRSLIAIDNLVDFIITCITNPSAADQTFLISDGHDVSTTELVRTMAAAANLRSNLVPVPVSWLQFAGQVIGKSSAIDRLCGNLQLDITKARSMLNWKPPVTFKEGVKRAMLTTGQVSEHAK